MTGQMITRSEDDGLCPKRLWVMNTLADDEGVDAAGNLPQGLTFHLSRCPSCRTLADQLLGINDGLDTLGGTEMPETLSQAANAQLEAALRDGARLSGRAPVIEEPELDAFSGRPLPRLRGLRYAAAACVALAAGLLAIWQASGTGDPTAGTKPESSVVESPFGTGGGPTLAPVEQAPADERITEVRQSPGDPGKDVAPDHEGCRHTSEVDRLMCERNHPIERAVQLPRRPQRRPSQAGQPPEPIDNSRATMSTMQKPDGRRKDR